LRVAEALGFSVGHAFAEIALPGAAVGVDGAFHAHMAILVADEHAVALDVLVAVRGAITPEGVAPKA
jgi:hypothetical protein